MKSMQNSVWNMHASRRRRLIAEGKVLSYISQIMNCHLP